MRRCFRGEAGGIAEAAGCGSGAECVVGWRRPEEVGETVREFIVIESADGGAARHRLGEVEKFRRTPAR
jgi:hypothetical protein